MTFPQQTNASPYQYANAAQRWRDSRTGQFVSESSVIAEMRVHQQATLEPLRNLTSNLYAGNISIEQWQVAAIQEMKDARLALAMYGAGGRDNMTAQKWGRVGGNLGQQIRYLDNFAQQIAAGQISEAQALARIEMYGRAVQEEFWNEYKDSQKEAGRRIIWKTNPAEHCGDCIDLEAGSPYEPDSLPTVPGAGDTACRTNCKCELHSESV